MSDRDLTLAILKYKEDWGVADESELGEILNAMLEKLNRNRLDFMQTTKQIQNLMTEEANKLGKSVEELMSDLLLK